MKRLLFFMLLPLLLFGQYRTQNSGSGYNAIRWGNLTSQVKDSIRARVDSVDALTNYDAPLGAQVFVPKISSSKNVGAGWFVVIDSTYPEGAPDYIAFDHPEQGKQWVRLSEIDSYIYNKQTQDNYNSDFGIIGSGETYIYRNSDSSFIVDRNLGGNIWNEINLTNSGAIVSNVYTPFKVTNQSIKQIFGYALVKDATTYGSWSTYSSTDPTPYIGHQILKSYTSNDSLELTLYFSGTIELVYFARPSNGIAKIKLDGDSIAMVDMYSPTDIYKQKYILKRNVKYGSHTITIINTYTHNTSSSGYDIYFDALIIKSNSINPSDDIVYPKIWKPNNVYSPYDEVIGENGKFYVTTTGGTSGDTIPSHTSGTVSDGGVDWTYIASSSFDYYETVFQKYGSELEYAYRFLPSGETNIEDIGGNIHGNEILDSIKLVIDGIEEDSIYFNEWYSGQNIEIKQFITDYYGEYSTKTNISNVVQIHSFDYNSMKIRYKLTWLVDGSAGWFYSAMWPLLVYNGTYQYKILDRFEYGLNKIKFKNYENDSSNPSIYNLNYYSACAIGRGFVDKGSGGIPTSDNGKCGIMFILRTTPLSVERYWNSGTKLSLYLNLNSGAYTGYSSWLSKIYFELYDTDDKKDVSSGDEISVENEYIIRIKDNFVDLSNL